MAIRFIFERLLLIALPRSSVETIGQAEDVVMRFLERLRNLSSGPTLLLTADRGWLSEAALLDQAEPARQLPRHGVRAHQSQ